MTTALFYILLFVFTAWYVVPFFWALVTSVKHPGMVFDGRWLPYERMNTITIDGENQEVDIVEERKDAFIVRVMKTGALREVSRNDVERVSPNWNNYFETWNIVPF